MVCNTGSGLGPTIDGKRHHLRLVGLYDGLFVMQDVETKTLWNHITGEAMYGPLLGRTLGPLTNVMQMFVGQALEMDPDIQIAISDRVYLAAGKRLGIRQGLPPTFDPANPNAQLSEVFIKTLGTEDSRRPRMDMGLGIWTDRTRRYYPMQRIRERGEAFIDRVDGRNVLIYIDAESSTPAALFVDAASAKLEGKEVRLDHGEVVRSNMLVDRAGRQKPVERPLQVFTRWYGFALTFPGADVFGQ